MRAGETLMRLLGGTDLPGQSSLLTSGITIMACAGALYFWLKTFEMPHIVMKYMHDHLATTS